MTDNNAKRDKLAQALQDAAIENLNEDMQSLLDCIDALPAQLDEKIKPTLDEIIASAHEIKTATDENRDEAIADLKNLRDDILVQFGTTISRTINDKLSSYEDALGSQISSALAAAPNNKPKSGLIKPTFCCLVGVVLGASVSSMYFNSKLTEKQNAVVSVLRATTVASSLLSQKELAKFNMAFNQQLN